MEVGYLFKILKNIHKNMLFYQITFSMVCTVLIHIQFLLNMVLFKIIFNHKKEEPCILNKILN